MLQQVLAFEGIGMVAALVLVAVVYIVEEAAKRLGWKAFYRLGFPLGRDLVPLPDCPPDEGTVGPLRWHTTPDRDAVHWWVDSRRGATLPGGLHGRIDLKQDRTRRIHLDVTWAPWWPPYVMCLWLWGFGASIGEGWFAGPMAILLMAPVTWLYWLGAQRAAADLRAAFVLRTDDDGRGPTPRT